MNIRFVVFEEDKRMRRAEFERMKMVIMTIRVKEMYVKVWRRTWRVAN